MLVSRLENLVSDRRLVEHCALRLDILYFLGYYIDEDLPWHSTISRTRQLYPAVVFEHLFEHVFAQCVAADLVTARGASLRHEVVTGWDMAAWEREAVEEMLYGQDSCK
jgi:transposase